MIKRTVFIASAFILLLVTQAVSGFSPGETNTAAFAAAGRNVSSSVMFDWIIAPELQETLQHSNSDELVKVIVTLRDLADLTKISELNRNERLVKVVELLQTKAAASQRPLRAFLENKRREGSVGEVISFWVFNGLAVEATPAVIAELAARQDVLRITTDETIPFFSDESSSTAVEPNISKVNAPILWNLGYRGQGIVVANMDTGVSLEHPDLIAQWRGGTNSWYDPYGENLAGPVDFNGHGTRTMGVMVGRSAGGSAIGVAPDAQWIAVKIFNNSGSATTSGIHLGFQWLLDPDGNPSTPDAPHVVNNSWNFTSTGCNMEFQLDLQALRAAMILPVFAAGNAGPNSSTSVSPANNPEAFAIGATDNYDQIYPLSSRGPSACGEETSTFPEMVAPGVNILSSDRYGTYFTSSGTSLAAPHVSGSLALLLSAFPNLSVSDQESALIHSAVDLGSSGADNVFGYGRLDISAAYEYILVNGGSPPAPTPTTMPTPTPEPPTPTPPFTTEPPTPTPTATPDILTNLALGKPVSVSSTLDSAHSGGMAVDGNLGTSWQTKRRSKLNTEWIQVDLGGIYSLSQVALRWDAKFATSYNIQVSADNQIWTILFNTSSADGEIDSISFNTVQARYVKMVSNAWIDASQRCWLLEFEVMGSGGSPSPTNTPAPTATPIASPTPTATQVSAGSAHIGDLDGSSTPNANRWNATVLITVHSIDEAPVASASVSGSWSGGVSGSGTCTTDSLGQCSLSMMSVRGNLSSVTFTVNTVSHSSLVYDSALNHDPDGDSNGSVITIARP
jgi:hypothetical protein